MDTSKKLTFCINCGFPKTEVHDKVMEIDQKTKKPYCAMPGIHKIYEDEILAIWREAIEKGEGWPIGEGLSLIDALQVEHIELIGYLGDLLIGTDGSKILVIGQTYLPWAVDITWFIAQNTKQEDIEVFY